MERLVAYLSPTGTTVRLAKTLDSLEISCGKAVNVMVKRADAGNNDTANFKEDTI